MFNFPILSKGQRFLRILILLIFLIKEISDTVQVVPGAHVLELYICNNDLFISEAKQA